MRKPKIITIETDDLKITYNTKESDRIVKIIERLIVKEYFKIMPKKITFKRLINDYVYHSTENNIEKFSTFARYFVLFSVFANIIMHNYISAIFLGILAFSNSLLIVFETLYRAITKEFDNLSEQEKEEINNNITKRIIDMINEKEIDFDKAIIESKELNKEDKED